MKNLVNKLDCCPPSTLSVPDIDEAVLERTVNILSAMADAPRLKILLLLNQTNELCVSQISEVIDDKTNTISMRLKKLYDAGLVSKRREAKHIFYRLKDKHVIDIINNAVGHANHD